METNDQKKMMFNRLETGEGRVIREALWSKLEAERIRTEYLTDMRDLWRFLAILFCVTCVGMAAIGVINGIN